MAALADSLVVLDFETTGLSPNFGDRAIEIAGVRLVDGQITERFASLMNPGRPVSAFIEGYTGITNEMLASAPSCAEVMADFADFIADDHLLAHNASFDKSFLDAELQRIDRSYSGKFLCSLLTSRRIYQNAPNHKLGSLISYKNIPPVEGDYHRALFDTEMTALLWLDILEEIKYQAGVEQISIEQIQSLSTTPKKSVTRLFDSW